MPTIELIYDSDCPNVEVTRHQLRLALDEVGLPHHWQEWDRAGRESPPHAQKYGSPTILVDGHDVAGELPAVDATSCRVYAGDDGQLQRVPPATAISTMLQSPGDREAPSSRTGWSGMLAVIPSIGTALLPSLFCPACLPAYAGILSALGVSFFNYTPYLLPLMIVFLTVAITSLGYGVKRHGGYKPFLVGLVASAVIITGKFAVPSELLVYAGLVLLVAASAWNTWSRKKVSSCTTSACCSPA